jgi:alkanesulfonate monooxygenase SsuD/methylene tetrahydromethanopterin reductase-like flavin-dependent oxidoreductase (luciferase family)
MRIGVTIGQTGRLSTPAALCSAAAAAEQVGYASVWVADHFHRPGAATSGSNGKGSHLPAILDPVVVLAMAASVTSRVRLGTGVLAASWYRPELLARSLATLNVLGEGRLLVGLDLGDGAQPEAVLDRLDTAWDGSPMATPMLVTRSRPPLLLAASTSRELERVARRADGWIPADLPVERLAPMWAQVRDQAASSGRDPEALLLIPRITALLVDRPLGPSRAPYHGSFEQVVDDLGATSDAGAHEVILGFDADLTLDEALDGFARLAETLEPAGAL